MAQQSKLVAPGRGRGLVDVFFQFYLLKLVVKKELRVRYHGSVLGMLWSYVKPATQFLVYFLAMGVFLSLGRTLEGYAVYLFAGMVVINYFSEVLSNSTRTLVWNAPLIKKIYLPREMFPVSSVWVAMVHLFPQVVVLLIGTLAYAVIDQTPWPGFQTLLLSLGAILLGVIIVTMTALGLGLIFGTFNVFYRDAENIVDLILLVAVWMSPVLYGLTMVENAFPNWLYNLYLLNPLTIAVELFHFGFWSPLTGATATMESLKGMTVVACVVSSLLLFLGQWVFKKYEGRFAQEL
ncbi:ABC transporter permease [Boudabousia marimammalium]|uniref:Transport permease protein n=1 Tax=Boudabousia marimammalium TaxID=156892 RepID=A0A1Q5PRU4_9ACTO|nr:ABC transporter permease [Boudabousia marimammalium]OKL50219.1 sugar ABC transporter permease [Boudabousia marimammalium]